MPKREVTFNEWLVAVTKESFKSRLRYGQIFFNMLPEDIRQEISGTEYDPFHLNADEHGIRMDTICKHVESLW